MKIIVKVKDIELEVNDSDNTSVIKYESYNSEVQKTIMLLCKEAVEILKIRNLWHATTILYTLIVNGSFVLFAD